MHVFAVPFIWNGEMAVLDPSHIKPERRRHKSFTSDKGAKINGVLEGIAWDWGESGTRLTAGTAGPQHKL